MNSQRIPVQDTNLVSDEKHNQDPSGGILDTKKSLTDGQRIVQSVMAEIKEGFNIKMQALPKIALSFENLSVWAKMKLSKGFFKSGKKFSFLEISSNFPNFSDSYNKLLLDNLDGQFLPGTSTAILGPSGSGKTTLLNFLAARMRTSTTLALSGKLLINGHQVESVKTMKHRFSYVMQQDIMYEDLSPYESILTTAKLSGVPNPEERT